VPAFEIIEEIIEGLYKIKHKDQNKISYFYSKVYLCIIHIRVYEILR